MPIEINGTSTPQTGQARDSGSLRVVSGASAPVQQAGDQSAGKDSVALTGVAALMQRLDSRISALPVVDTARVNAIRQSLADGGFHPDYLRVADRIIDQEIAVHGLRTGESAG